MKRSTRGKHANTRYVCDILPQTEAAESLLVVEVRTPGGHASSYPPHKHDQDNVPLESSLEETVLPSAESTAKLRISVRLYR